MTKDSSELPSAGLSTKASAEASEEHAPEPSVGRSAEAMATNSYMGLMVEPPAVEGSAEPAPETEGGLPVQKPTGLPTECPAELSAQSSPPVREVEMLAEGRMPEAVEKPEGKTATAAADADAATPAAAMPTGSVAVEVSMETPVEKQPVEKSRTVTAAATAVAAATTVGVAAATAASAVATAAVAINSPVKDKTAGAGTETAAEPAVYPATTDPLAELSASMPDKAPSRRKMASRLPSDEEAVSQSEEKLAKNPGAAASAITNGSAVSSPDPDDTITANTQFLSHVPMEVPIRSVPDKKREVSSSRESLQGRASCLGGRPLPSRSTHSLRVSPRGRSPRGRRRSLSPKSSSKLIVQSRSQEGTSPRSMSRPQQASSPLRSMAQSDEAASPSPPPAAAPTPAAASTLTSEKASVITRSSTSASAAPAADQTTGDVLATVVDAKVVVAVAAGATATADAEAAVADAVATTKENANKKTGKGAERWSSNGAGGGMDENASGKTEMVVSSDSSAANNLRERSGEEENIWVSAVDNGDAVRHRASGRYRRGVQHRPSARGGEAALGNQASAPSSGPSAEASGGVIAAAVTARSRVEAAKAAAAVPAPAGRGPPAVTAQTKKARKRGKSISRTVARIFGRRERTATVTRGGGVG